MIEERVKSFLDAEFAEDNIPIVLEIPKNIPESFIIFQRVDIGRTNRIDAVTLEFRSYGPSNTRRLFWTKSSERQWTSFMKQLI